MRNQAKVFQGISKATQRKFYGTLLAELRKAGYQKVAVPFAGEFTLARCALTAGFEAKQIRCSDINAYPSLLGYLYAGRPIESLKIGLPAELQEVFSSSPSPAHQVALVIWLMKVTQLKEQVEYENQIRRHLFNTREQQVEQLAGRLEKLRNDYAGIWYEIQDARNTLVDGWLDDKTVVLAHPPAYAKGYEKQFDFHGIVEWPWKFSEFSFKDEFVDIFHECTLRDSLYIWSSYRSWDEIPPEHYVFAEQVNVDRWEYYLASHPDRLRGSSVDKGVFFKKELLASPRWPIVPEDYEITEKTKVTVKVVNKDVALYYRDLWAHKLGVTKAEIYFLVLLDGKVWGVVGWFLRDALTLKSNEASEVFGFDAPLQRHPKSHRLFMMLLCSDDFRRMLTYRFKTNRIFDLRVFKTTCMTKYRKLKSSNGLLDIQAREKLPDGNYRLVYTHTFYPRGFAQCIVDWLEENRKNPLSSNKARIDLEEDDG